MAEDRASQNASLLVSISMLGICIICAYRQVFRPPMMTSHPSRTAWSTRASLFQLGESRYVWMGASHRSDNPVMPASMFPAAMIPICFCP